MKHALGGFLILASGFCVLVFGPGLVANPDDGTLPARFVRGDTNNDGREDISDAVFLLNYLFGGGAPPPCDEVADINDDGNRDLSDSVYLLRHLFLGAPEPPAPFPECGDDPGGARCRRSVCNY